MTYDKTKSRTVDAMKKTDIEQMHTTLLRKYPEIYADVWKIGCNLALRISDLLSLKFADLDLENRTLTLTEQKTNKVKHIRLNNAAIEVIARRKAQNASARAASTRARGWARRRW